MSIRGRGRIVLGVGLATLAVGAPATGATRRRSAKVARPAVAQPAVAVAQPAADQACSVSAGAACSRLSIGAVGATLLNTGTQLANGNAGGSVGTLVGGAASTVISSATTAISLAAISAVMVGGAQGVLRETATALGTTTSPHLESTWFSSTYWRMTAIAAVLTLPFLFAAAVQALIRSDIALLAKAAFGYLPLAMLVIAIAAPLTALLLAACDQLCSVISSAAGNAGAHFLDKISLTAAALTAFAVSPFVATLVGLFVIGAAFTLWVELLLREAAVYVIVLMLPLAFAAFVWPARRIWAIRAVELLVALILSKFAIVAVLSLGGAAITASDGSVTALMAGAVLIMLAAFSPWVLLRLIPLAEIAGGAVGSLRGELRSAGATADAAMGLAGRADEWVGRVTSEMRRDADARGGGSDAPRTPPTTPPASPEPGPSGPEPPPSGPVPGAGTDSAEDEGASSVAENLSQAPALEFDREKLESTPVWPNEAAE